MSLQVRNTIFIRIRSFGQTKSKDMRDYAQNGQYFGGSWIPNMISQSFA